MAGIADLDLPERPSRAVGLRKQYGRTTVLDGVDLELRAGRVHALLGANGAGKSTLIKCLSGATAPSGGHIELNGKRFDALTPREAIDVGVAVIYQHFSLVPSLSAADNIFLGLEMRRGLGLVQRAAQARECQRLLDGMGLDLPPDAPVGTLPVATQQLVEIAKALRRRASLLVLDEPTASLGEAERQSLLAQVRRLRDAGLQILYVTHLLPEIFEIADEVTVLRDGRVVLNSPVGETEEQEIVAAISGRLTRKAGTAGRGHMPRGNPVLAANGLEGERLGPVDLALHEGEIVGVFGLLGSGRTELLETIFGIRPVNAGSVTLHGRTVRLVSPGDSIRRGVALVPAERGRQSMFGLLSARDNVLLPRVAMLGRHGVRRPALERRSFAATAHDVHLPESHGDAPASKLSGGNQQKTAVGRWLGREQAVRVLMLDDPTQGVDVGARQQLYATLQETTAQTGLAVLLASSSPEEIVAVADRAVVLHNGRVIQELTHPHINVERLLGLAHGMEA
ncbi:MAG: ribose import ATP-binding protein [Chthonomonadaceae bacterium]|nr:ribose import ATP-binding protein [Chthonomonadaceae bacterium]